MKRFFLAAVVAGATAGFSAASLAADVNLSVRIGDPNFFGRIDIGGYPPPPLLHREPLIVERIAERREPVYLRVPPGHAKHWSRHCHRYHACGERVYFVKDDWYRNDYVPRHRARAADRREDRHERWEDRRERRDDRRDRRDDRRDDRRGPPPGDRWDDRPGDDRGRRGDR